MEFEAETLRHSRRLPHGREELEEKNDRLPRDAK